MRVIVYLTDGKIDEFWADGSYSIVRDLVCWTNEDTGTGISYSIYVIKKIEEKE